MKLVRLLAAEAIMEHDRRRVTPAEFTATKLHLDRVLEELEPTQEIVRTAFEPELPPMSGDDPLEQTQEIFPNATVSGVWAQMRRVTPCGEIRTLERYRK